MLLNTKVSLVFLEKWFALMMFGHDRRWVVPFLQILPRFGPWSGLRCAIKITIPRRDE